MKKFLVTSALPYANGPLHFGHLAGAYLPADVYVRHKRLLGRKVMFISGSDEHGVAITMNAGKEGRSYKEYVNEWHKAHSDLFKEYDIRFDFFGQTSEEYHAKEATKWFSDLYEKGAIEPREEQQLKCFDCSNLLPDRYVEGECYECGYENARGDECPNCGTWIDPIKLKNPVCKFCESKNIKAVEVTQYYLMLSKYEKQFTEWFSTKKHWRKTVVPFIEGLMKEGMVDRAITRDLDWGIDVPLDEAKGKKLYVWFDAPIGYVSNTKKFLEESKSKEDYLEDWWKNSDTEILHFIGKDNIIFHAMIFPIMGMASGIINPPSDVPANQYVNLEGKQFSKSSGWYVDAKKALDDFGVDSLRYYLISIIPENNDSSFSWQQFSAKVNGELANNIGNFINRALKFFEKNWPEGMKESRYATFSSSKLAATLKIEIHNLSELLDAVQIRKGLEKFMNIGDICNGYFNDHEPWKVFKQDPQAAEKIIAHSVQLVAILSVIAEPFLPTLANKIQGHFGQLLTPEVKSQIYQGKLTILDHLFKDGFTLSEKPQALIAKIDEDKIKELEQELKNKS